LGEEKNTPNPRPKKSVRMNLPIALPLGLLGDDDPAACVVAS
jgi:hypothetical protein